MSEVVDEREALGEHNRGLVVGRRCVLDCPDTGSRAAVDFFTTMINIHHLSFGYGTHAGATGGNRLVIIPQLQIGVSVQHNPEKSDIEILSEISILNPSNFCPVFPY